MMVNRKVPLRKCVASQEMHPKKELLRIVRTPDGEVTIDLTGKANGRGAYIYPSEECLSLAKKYGSLEKALEVKIPAAIYDDIAEEIHARSKG